MVKDLFGEIPVTRDDVEKWLEQNAPNLRERYKEKYVEYWNVVRKIQKAKKNGTFR